MRWEEAYRKGVWRGCNNPEILYPFLFYNIFENIVEKNLKILETVEN